MTSTTWPQVAGNVHLILAANPKRQEETQADVPGFLLASFPIYSSPTGSAADIKLLDVRIVSSDEHDIVGAALPFDCDVIFFGTETQPVFTIAASCPGKDLVRLWPLPMQSPWDDSRWEPVEGGAVI